MSRLHHHLAFAYEEPRCHGVLRAALEDFQVEEVLGFEPDGEGEHVFLYVEKRNTNTQWLAEQLARYANIPKRDVGYAGLKDKNAVSRQWFSLGMAGKAEPDWSKPGIEGVSVLRHLRHRRKLRRGTLQGNRFVLLLRDLAGDMDDLERRLQRIARRGVPNYFGEQRFGHNDANIEQAVAMFKGRPIRNRNKRSLYLSAARAFLFNELLSERVRSDEWDRAIDGDVMLLAGTNSYFVIEKVTDEIHQRVRDFDIHPSGCLWGRGVPAAQWDAGRMELALPQLHPVLCRGLEKAGVEQSRRAFRLPVKELQWRLERKSGVLELRFFLPAGAYATSVVREICNCATRV